MTQIEQPFQLRKVFRRRIIPVMLTIMLVLVAGGGLAAAKIAETIYLNLGQSRAEIIAATVEAEAPESWSRLLANPILILSDQDELKRINQAFANAIAKSRIARIKVYEPGSRMVVGDDPARLGEVEAAPALHAVLTDGDPVLVRKDEAAGAVYELYVPYRPSQPGAHTLVFEIYEPVGYLDRLLWLTTGVQAGFPLLMLAGFLLWLRPVIWRAQAEIDSRTDALMTLQRRLERFVSASAKGAAMDATGGRIPSRVADMTLFYSDVVDFTGYSENNPAQTVVDFLNRLMTIQVAELHRFGGDVDKMIGDAVLACFEGPDRAERAVAAAQAIQERLAQEDHLPRAIRIGLYDGYVISGAIGPDERQDYTVIGDSVNVAARLCAAARPGEVLSDQRTLARAGHPPDFSAPEDIAVKGRTAHLAVRRWSARQA